MTWRGAILRILLALASAAVVYAVTRDGRLAFTAAAWSSIPAWTVARGTGRAEVAAIAGTVVATALVIIFR